MKLLAKSIKSSLSILLIFPFIGFSQQSAPNSDWGNLNKYNAENKKLQLSNGIVNAVFMGDSITEFWKVNDSTFFDTNSYCDRGISGQTTPQMLLRFRQDVIELKPKVVVILAGINDIAENTGPISNESIFGNIVSMAELAKSNNIKVIICSILPANKFPWRQEILPAERVISINAMLKTYAQKNKIVYLDYFCAMVDANKGLNPKYGDDGVHPNLNGYKIMELLVKESIDKAINN